MIPYPFVSLRLQFCITMKIVIVICNMQCRKMFKWTNKINVTPFSYFYDPLPCYYYYFRHLIRPQRIVLWSSALYTIDQRPFTVASYTKYSPPAQHAGWMHSVSDMINKENQPRQHKLQPHSQYLFSWGCQMSLASYSGQQRMSITS